MFVLSEIVPAPPGLFDTLTSLGTAGVMGAMWLWERRTSRQREQQLDETHARVMGDRVALDQLMAVVRQNAEALTRMTATHEQVMRQLGPRGAA